MHSVLSWIGISILAVTIMFIGSAVIHGAIQGARGNAQDPALKRMLAEALNGWSEASAWQPDHRREQSKARINVIRGKAGLK